MDTPRLYVFSPPLDDNTPIQEQLKDVCSHPLVAALLIRSDVKPLSERMEMFRRIMPMIQAYDVAAMIHIDADDPLLDLQTLVAACGADGLHIEAPIPHLKNARQANSSLLIGAGGLRARHDAMEAGEAGADYVLFGEPDRENVVPPFSAVLERTSWWAQVFEIPCVIYVPFMDKMGEAIRTGAEFLAVGELLWHHPEGPRAALDRIDHEIASLTALA